MRIARVQTELGPQLVSWDVTQWRPIVSYEDPRFTGDGIGADFTLLAPVVPRLILGMMHNSGPEGRSLTPQAFIKAPHSVAGPGDPIRVEQRWGETIGEGELVLVVGKRCRNLTGETAREAVLGWTIGNDVTCRGQIPLDATMVQAKCGDGFSPIGPWIETDLDVSDLTIIASVDGVESARNTTAQLSWDPYEALIHFSHHMTLDVGDIIMTGCPGTALPLPDGAEVAVTIQGIGTLTSAVTHV